MMRIADMLGIQWLAKDTEKQLAIWCAEIPPPKQIQQSYNCNSFLQILFRYFFDISYLFILNVCMCAVCVCTCVRVRL